MREITFCKIQYTVAANNKMDLKGKNAVVTGGIGDIGIAIAQQLLKNGIQVKKEKF